MTESNGENKDLETLSGTKANERRGEKHLLAQVATHHSVGHADGLGHQLAAEVPIKGKPGRPLGWKEERRQSNTHAVAHRLPGCIASFTQTKFCYHCETRKTWLTFTVPPFVQHLFRKVDIRDKNLPEHPLSFNKKWLIKIIQAHLQQILFLICFCRKRVSLSQPNEEIKSTIPSDPWILDFCGSAHRSGGRRGSETESCPQPRAGGVCCRPAGCTWLPCSRQKHSLTGF